MSGIEAADKLEIQILVDNATDMLSSNPPFVESEAANLTRRGFRLNAYKCLCCAVHGLSCLVTVHRGDVRRTVLFDTGPEGLRLRAQCDAARRRSRRGRKHRALARLCGSRRRHVARARDDPRTANRGWAGQVRLMRRGKAATFSCSRDRNRSGILRLSHLCCLHDRRFEKTP